MSNNCQQLGYMTNVFIFLPNVKINVFCEVNGSELCCDFPELVAERNSFIAKSVVCILLSIVLCFQ